MKILLSKFNRDPGSVENYAGSFCVILAVSSVDLITLRPNSAGLFYFVAKYNILYKSIAFYTKCANI